MNLTPFRYPGAKNKLLSILDPYLQNILYSQNNFADIFVGGGSVLLHIAQKYPNINLYCNDLDPWISNFWKILSSEDDKKTNELLDRLNNTPTIDQFYKLAQTPPITQEEQAFYALWFNRTTFNGIIKRDNKGYVKSNPIGGKDQKSKYKVNCRYNFDKLKQKILQCHNLLKGRTIVSNDNFVNYHILINTNIPAYIDPPYVVKGNILYHETMNFFEHQSLAHILHKRQNWVVSYDDTPEVRMRYKNQQVIDLSARYCINGKKETWTNKNELIILS